ncbi:carboxypeptidase-like regulatory domain-containing protein [Algoriphagus zhangzhouensis]|uniref:CarboxypepD_reg-like domain-containing protein n=1 Tax=Algoriphagus zhangzhouensis TaxID=1073327 RepID=A0A1M7ZEN6_9BACT|nr:carboxypeptidase-like regulatory domain-containing protein [Algoriphagus zhangzhouensis]TDY46079.1 carboxypeptidase-like protein [Algoriphagus zhangzhouensis]SHO63334.1 CarboxypepD_reg-like domain-containing protein [Algoriphagus zhangzhouensis]
MTKRLSLLLFLFFYFSFQTWSQIRITGKVIDKDDKSPIPGVQVQEKGIENGTVTKTDGTFELNVSDPNAALVFSFIGMRTEEVPLKGKNQIVFVAKWDCNKDFFDSQEISFFTKSGIINNPIGGEIEIASPWIFRGVIKGKYGYQTNFKENHHQNAQIEFAHSISNCDFDIDFRWDYREISWEQNLRFHAHSFEIDLNIHEIKFIAGYSHLNFSEIENQFNKTSSGVLIGVGKYFSLPMYPTAIFKLGIYQDKLEYQAKIQGGIKNLQTFIKFYKLNDYNELSLGIGISLGYKTKRQKLNSKD